jgi:hypothetical protein
MISREPFGLEAILRHIDKGHVTIDGATVLARRYREIRKKVAGWCESAAKANARADRLAAEVEKMRITEDEHDALDEARRLGDQWGWSETIRALQKRHAE